MKLLLTVKLLVIGVIICLFFACKEKEPEAFQFQFERMNGVSFVSPRDSFPSTYMNYVEQVGADCIAVSPFAFSGSENDQNLVFNSNFQWWGEKPNGVRAIIDYAQDQELRVMLKPQVWIPGGWAGHYDAGSESAWLNWEQDYMAYIITFAQIAAEKEVDLFCIGTEFRVAVEKRPEFWNTVIDSVKTIYNGKLTYAANWDDYEQVPFWGRLDFIGVDAYFPLVEEKAPELDKLLDAWQPLVNKLESYSKHFNKPILFTEYGYLSVDYTSWQNWENEKNLDNLAVNLQAQQNAFEALFTSLWEKPWMAGGFIWKWYDDYESSGGLNNKDYTPQRKPVETTIKNWYDKN